VKILLDENFSLQLYQRLRLSGYDVEHIIILGQRGIPDSAIRERIFKEDGEVKLSYSSEVLEFYRRFHICSCAFTDSQD
jgi:hypothetical protein